MATDKQIRYIRALAARKGVEIDINAIAELSNGEVSAKIEELQQLPDKPQQQEEVVEEEVKPEINGQRFGMCVKLLVESGNLHYWLTHKKEFKKELVRLYKLVTEAEEEVASALE